jgi:Uncharacterized conserved protein
MERRDFIKKSVVAGAALSLTFEDLSAALSTNKIAIETAPDMVAVMGGEPKEMLEKALEALGGIEKFVKKGQKIVIKPNVAWDRAPEMAGNTNPELVEALVRKCLEAGAEKVTVFDNTCDAWQRCYETSGIERVVRAAGGIMMPANTERYYREVKLPRGVNLKSALIHESLIEADAWINVPVLKDHGGAKLTSAMKNYMGIVWDRRVFHQNDLQQCIADICTWEKKPVLNIVDAYRIMHQNGPQGRSLADVATLKSLIASPDIVAVDTAALRMFNQVKELDMEAVGHIGKGEEFKLGTTNLDKLNIKRIRI